MPAVQKNAAKNLGWHPEDVPGVVTRDFYRAGLARREDSCVAEPVLQNAGACVTKRRGGIVKPHGSGFIVRLDAPGFTP